MKVIAELQENYSELIKKDSTEKDNRLLKEKTSMTDKINDVTEKQSIAEKNKSRKGNSTNGN